MRRVCRRKWSPSRRTINRIRCEHDAKKRRGWNCSYLAAKTTAGFGRGKPANVVDLRGCDRACPGRASGRFQERAAAETRFYTIFLGSVLVIAVTTAPAQISWPRLRQFRQNLHPILTAATLLLCLWEIITSGVRLLPLPYFPSPAGVLQSLINDRVLLFDSTWHSLLLLLSGYALGVIAGLITGICIGWFTACPLLGNAVAESRRPDSRHGVDSAGDGGLAIAPCSRPWH